jgi:hypothetical protein
MQVFQAYGTRYRTLLPDGEAPNAGSQLDGHKSKLCATPDFVTTIAYEALHRSVAPAELYAQTQRASTDCLSLPSRREWGATPGAAHCRQITKLLSAIFTNDKADRCALHRVPGSAVRNASSGAHVDPTREMVERI